MALGKSLDSILGDYFGDEVVTLDKKEQTQVATKVLQRNQEIVSPSANSQHNIKSIPVELIEASPFQTRRDFDELKIDSLARSIKKSGLIHPIVVLHKVDGGYMLIAGERRLRAFRSLNKPEILAIVKEESSLNETQHSLLTAMENLQREDLNPLELAETYVILMQTQNLDEDGLAQMLEHSTQYVRNYLRLLQLSQPVKDALCCRKIGEGQARHLVGLSEDKQKEMLDLIIQKDLTVREIAEVLKNSKNKLKKDNKFIPNYHKVSNIYYKKLRLWQIIYWIRN
ncbi:ParB/RepB/Spo0J family partition protein [Candidatus Gracilibacteria bacterium]|nr:ParB/RepB/Spo0J family partition protein [Candidatus Gracilibacteria bacterium]